MEQKLFAFWRYDLYPFILCGEVTRVTDTGAVETVEYGKGFLFQPILIVPYDVGTKMRERLRDLAADEREALEAHEAKWRAKINEVHRVFEPYGILGQVPHITPAKPSAPIPAPAEELNDSKGSKQMDNTPKATFIDDLIHLSKDGRNHLNDKLRSLLKSLPVLEWEKQRDQSHKGVVGPYTLTACQDGSWCIQSPGHDSDGEEGTFNLKYGGSDKGMLGAKDDAQTALAARGVVFLLKGEIVFSREG